MGNWYTFSMQSRYRGPRDVLSDKENKLFPDIESANDYKKWQKVAGNI